MPEQSNVGNDPGWGQAAFWPEQARWRGVVWIALIVGVYVGTAALLPWFGGIGLLWLPNAVLATALLRFRPRDWSYVYSAGILAEVVSTLNSDWGMYQSLAMGVLNDVEATLFVLVAARIAGGRNTIGLLSERGALGLIVGAIMTPVVTSTLGGVVVAWSWSFGADYLTTWRTLWFGDSLGLLVGVPAGLLLRDAVRSVGRRRNAPLALGGGGAALLLFVVSAVLAAKGNSWGAQQTAVAAAVLLSLTFGAIGAPAGAMFTTTATIIGITRQLDDIGSVPRSQLLLVVVFAAIYAIAATTESASRAKGELETANAQLSSYLGTVQTAVEHAEAANKAKSDFLATMSHELRTPLNSILGFSDLLRRDPTLSADQRDDLDIINRSGGHLLGLINQVLDMAKIESGRTQLEVSPMDLPLLIEDVELMMRARAEAAGLQFVVEVADDVPRYIRCDGQKLRQIMLNLLGNSLKFTTSGVVSLRVHTAAKAGSLLVIEVEDTGAGIPEDQQERVFEPFTQLQKVGAPGTGLGLALVREYTDLMGGSVELRSRLGFGSVFRVSIPVDLARAEDVKTADESRHVAGLAPGQPQWRVLVVEDEPLNRLLLGRLLEDAGFVVAYAENGAECLKVFGDFQPDLIWMDRRMPLMDGLEATSRIRQRDDGQLVKIVALTASVFEDQRDEWVRAGIDSFVRKPFRESEIFDCMARLLGVEYLYEEPAEQLPRQLSGDLAATLSELPETLRTQLTDALVVGGTGQLTEALGKVRLVSPELADALELYIQEFNYTPVLEALDDLRSR